jgi:hypothetical protein
MRRTWNLVSISTATRLSRRFFRSPNRPGDVVAVEALGYRSVQHGVSWYTGRRYAFDGQSKPFARFSFAWLNERELPEAVKRMAAARP